MQLSVLRQAGIHMPAQAVYELELSGWPIQRVAAGVRLRPDGERHPEPPPPRPRVRRVGSSEE